MHRKGDIRAARSLTAASSACCPTTIPRHALMCPRKQRARACAHARRSSFDTPAPSRHAPNADSSVARRLYNAAACSAAARSAPRRPRSRHARSTARCVRTLRAARAVSAVRVAAATARQARSTRPRIAALAWSDASWSNLAAVRQSRGGELAHCRARTLAQRRTLTPRSDRRAGPRAHCAPYEARGAVRNRALPPRARGRARSRPCLQQRERAGLGPLHRECRGAGECVPLGAAELCARLRGRPSGHAEECSVHCGDTYAPASQ